MWFATAGIPSIRAETGDDRLLVSTDGPVDAGRRRLAGRDRRLARRVPAFGSLAATPERIVQSGRGPGIWTALPSIGLVDAMRIGPDVIGMTDDPKRMNADIEHARTTTAARAWMHARLWANDPDHLLVRPGIAVRDAWAKHIAGSGGLTFSSDRLAQLDEHGLELTRRTLRPSSTEPRDWTLDPKTATDPSDPRR